jgi:hypothetical protein
VKFRGHKGSVAIGNCGRFAGSERCVSRADASVLHDARERIALLLFLEFVVSH